MLDPVNKMLTIHKDVLYFQGPTVVQHKTKPVTVNDSISFCSSEDEEESRVHKYWEEQQTISSQYTLGNKPTLAAPSGVHRLFGQADGKLDLAALNAHHEQREINVEGSQRAHAEVRNMLEHRKEVIRQYNEIDQSYLDGTEKVKTLDTISNNARRASGFLTIFGLAFTVGTMGFGSFMMLLPAAAKVVDVATGIASSKQKIKNQHYAAEKTLLKEKKDFTKTQTENHLDAAQRGNERYYSLWARSNAIVKAIRRATSAINGG